MKKVLFITLMSLCLSSSFYSCREKTEKEKLIDEMKDEGADIDVSDDGDKIKMETDEKSVKIKEDDGDTKIKVKTEDDDN